MEKLLKRIFVIAIAMLVLCTFAAFAGGGKEESRETTGGEAAAETAAAKSTTVTWSYSQEPPNWDYRKTGLTAVTAPLLLNVWETLIQLEADGSSVGLLAESWEISPDGLTITFKLRQDVKFHDGSDFTSADVVYSMNSNAEASVDRAKTPYNNVTGVEALDDYTVKLTLAQSDIRFIYNMSDRAGIMVPEGFFEDNDAATTVIGTGPYVFAEYRIDQDLTMTRFEDYWGDKPYFETAIHRFIPDETAAINALLGGEIDFVASIIAEGMDRVFTVSENNDNIALTLIPGTEVSYWALNTHVKVFQDIRVRQAIQYGHNRQAHIDAATAGTATPSASMAVPAGVAWDSDYTPYPYNPDKAVQLLKEAGYGPGELVLDFPFANVAWHTIMAQVFQAEMAEVGITINLRSLDLATWLDQVNTQGQYEVFQITSGAPLTNYGCGRGRQPFGKDNRAFCDDGMDKLIAKVEAQSDWDAYVDAQRELHNYVADQGWIFATKKPNIPVLYRSDLVGIKEHRLPDIHIYVGDLRWDD
jgi:peptide/nickel transport system substrate-binding protein